MQFQVRNICFTNSILRYSPYFSALGESENENKGKYNMWREQFVLGDIDSLM